MGCWVKGTCVPKVWIKCFEMRFLLVCFLFVLSDAARLLSFPGSTFCLDGEILIKKPKDVLQSAWQSPRVVDSSGSQVEDCHVLPDGSLLTIPERCINHETGRRVAHISLNNSSEMNTIYQISCPDEQADAKYGEPVIECNQQSMMATISRRLSDFDDEIIGTPPPSVWSLRINSTLIRLDVATARSLGYTLTTDASSLMIRAKFNAFGIKNVTHQGQSFYRGDISLIQVKGGQRITIDVTMICAAGPAVCDKERMTLWLPPAAGSLQLLYIGDVRIPLTPYSLQQQGMTVDTSNGIQLNITLDKLEVLQTPNKKSYRLPSLTLIIFVDGVRVPMTLSPVCEPPSPVQETCTRDGFMVIEVFATSTTPVLNLTTVRVRDRTCPPVEETSTRVVFKFPLTDCGTTKRFVDGRMIYENEVSALWKNLPRRIISRDSELRQTVWCFYKGSGLEILNVSVATLPPPASSRNDGPLVLVINIYPDLAYQIPYRDDQYPLVKPLRDPIFLEVQVLNRNDPNIELFLEDCWATMSPDPKALPQWNVVVDGCEESKDNYLTKFHPVDGSVPQAKYRKRFEVKAFAFMQGGELSNNLVYFHCSAIICSLNALDSPLCTKTCLPSRKKRDDVFLNRHSNLASPPGPVLLLDSEPSLKSEDVQDVVKQVTVGVLPAFALVAVIVLVAMLISLIRKSKL
ncbi:zona pellucida sperm-binding protein 2 [Engystomops pustulosus]|uniref:zona pellucida sperm-binding protein 2 n=1 Tax=Engystomops pustulosus TaxID=76066 RepID=UPI003AFA2133